MPGLGLEPGLGLKGSRLRLLIPSSPKPAALSWACSQLGLRRERRYPIANNPELLISLLPAPGCAFRSPNIPGVKVGSAVPAGRAGVHYPRQAMLTPAGWSLVQLSCCIRVQD